MTAVRWSVCFHFQREIGAGSSLPGSSLRATNVAYSWSMRYHPKVLVQPKETVTVWLRTEFILPFAGVSIDSCLNSICQNVTFFSLTFKVMQGNGWFTSASADSLTFTLAAQTFLDPVANRWSSLQFSSRYLCKARLGMGECFMQRAFFFFFLFFYSWQKCLHRWDAVWVCLPLLWLLFVHEHASSAFFH